MIQFNMDMLIFGLEALGYWWHHVAERRDNKP
jgi:hypothetical protein